ncbi:MSM1 [Candida pseudojiufengensis]|uniref:MSM1 n=1 Tax=Candida pseudojiufengensis TaxID=497109 RepID=UPI0022247979|nr:MSM1 [Candida pseudojiufengensis]KAI5964131.1 MSM1 [Candida pseudojiufengensis]
MTLRYSLIKRFNQTKPFYVTTPIFYVNASPHLGHLYSMLIADTRSRWEKLNPKNSSYMLTGTDEHGLKIQTVAEKQGIDPKLLCDQVSKNFKDLSNKFNIDYDRFIRTTDQDHIKVTHYFWNIMKEKGLIEKGSHSGWYCVSDETFYPEANTEEIEKNGKTIRISSETKNEVIYQEETNYFFKLSAFQDQLIKYLKENPNFIKPTHRYKFILNELMTTKLPDLSISRPSSRLKWSIEVPNDSTQKIYVWFDALLNYLTATGFPNGFEQDSKYVTPKNNLWPATHIIGKDIIRFHCIYWPIFLLAAGIELPKQIIVHSHWLCEGFKMSKSLGNVVDPIEMSEFYGIDSIRFFLIENSNIDDDCKFSENLLERSRDSLLGKYCNLLSRIGGINFNIEESVQYYKNSQFNDIKTFIKNNSIKKEIVPTILQISNELQENLNNLYDNMNQKIIEFDYIRAIQLWWQVINQANQLFQISEPWLYVKALNSNTNHQSSRLDPEMIKNYKKLINYYVYLCSETIRISSILIQPIIPSLSNDILNRLNVEPSKRNSNFVKIGKDLNYGKDANSKIHKLPLQKLKSRIK